eukprot:3885915-Prymnesium_polylepis.1
MSPTVMPDSGLCVWRSRICAARDARSRKPSWRTWRTGLRGRAPTRCSACVACGACELQHYSTSSSTGAAALRDEASNGFLSPA